MKINILYCSDNNYAPYLGISITSVLKSNQDVEKITFYVVNDNISEDNLNRLKQCFEGYGQSRELILIDGRAWVDRLVEMDIFPYRGGQTTNLRLFFMEYIERDVDRLLYLDCDTLVLESLQPLFETDMGDAAGAVVLDSLSGAEYKKIVGFEAEDHYFNAGVVLFDVANWKKHECERRLSEYMRDPKYHLPNNDQDFLNILLKDCKTILSPKYNFQVTHRIYSNKAYYKIYSKVGYYKSEEIDAARSTPVILHAYRFLGQFPWHKNALHPWRSLWWEYVKNSNWSDLVPRENKGMTFALERILYRVLPQGLFLLLFKKLQTHLFIKKLKTMKKKKGVS